MDTVQLVPLRRTPPRHGDSALAALVIIAILFLAGPASASAAAPFSTFLQANLSAVAVGHDAAGNIFLLGTSNQVPGEPFAASDHPPDIVVMRLDPAASQVAYFVYVGSSSGSPEAPSAMAVDTQGNAYITGTTSSSGFPATFGGPVPDGTVRPFVVKLDPNGRVVYASVFAAASVYPDTMALDSSGNLVVTGMVPDQYPATPGAVSLANPTKQSAAWFVTKLDPTATKILFSAVGVGGSRMALGPQGDIFLAGNTNSTAYPTTPGAFQTTFTPAYSCGSEGFCIPAFEQFVTRLSADGTKLVYSTFLTGSTGSENSGLAVDSAGNAYVTGSTASQDYPFTATLAADRPGLFLSKLDPTGAKLLWSVRQGGNVLALDRAGNPVVGGSFVPTTPPPSYPPGYTFPPPPPTGNTPAACLPNGITVQSMGYVQSFSAQDGSTTATQLLSATQATASGITIEPDGRAVLGGFTEFPDIPLTPGVAYDAAVAQRTASGAFLAAFDLSQTATGPQLGCVLDAATFMPVGPIAPGQLISLFGYELGPSVGLSATLPVTFDGTAAPLLYVSSGQLNVQVPYSVQQAASTVMTVSVNSGPVATRTFVVTASSPSVFLDLSVSPASCGPLPDGSMVFAAVALNGDGSRNSCANPAKPGSVRDSVLERCAAACRRPGDGEFGRCIAGRGPISIRARRVRCRSTRHPASGDGRAWRTGNRARNCR